MRFVALAKAAARLRQALGNKAPKSLPDAQFNRTINALKEANDYRTGTTSISRAGSQLFGMDDKQVGLTATAVKSTISRIRKKKLPNGDKPIDTLESFNAQADKFDATLNVRKNAYNKDSDYAQAEADFFKEFMESLKAKTLNDKDILELYETIESFAQTPVQQVIIAGGLSDAVKARALPTVMDRIQKFKSVKELDDFLLTLNRTPLFRGLSPEDTNTARSLATQVRVKLLQKKYAEAAKIAANDPQGSVNIMTALDAYIMQKNARLSSDGNPMPMFSPEQTLALREAAQKARIKYNAGFAQQGPPTIQQPQAPARPPSGLDADPLAGPLGS